MTQDTDSPGNARDVNTAPASLETAEKLGLNAEEYNKIKEILGRTPNFTELSVYSVMWSEHCSYKNSIHWLKQLPKAGKRVLAGAGEENAGLMDIGDGLAVCFKIESHNHPSAIEPYQGAATGVGGIHRDIFTMGARPIAALNSLRFGPLTEARNRHLLRGVARGIGDYGNSFGVPTVGGEIFFDPCYNTNPLVNAMSAGVVETGKTVSAIAEGIGNPVFIVGSATGKDGIHGASFASKDITADSADDLPAVQVGDPFQEKLLLEATLEVVETGAVVGMQDMGAAGIACSTSEMSEKGGVGMDIWLDRAPLRQPDMQPFEILLSESQERMLIVGDREKEAHIYRVFEKWDLPCVQIGVVTGTGLVRYYWQKEKVGEIPAESLVLGGGAPVYIREYSEPEYAKLIKAWQPPAVSADFDLPAALAQVLGLPTIASKRWIYEQYDSTVGAATLTANLRADAAIVELLGTEKALAFSVDCNPRYAHADPETGCALAVAEAARNIVCAGGEPLGITNCLNFGNPYNEGVYWQFVGAIKGMKAACEAFGLPVTGGNVSFYNQSPDGPVFPTPSIGMVGLLEDKSLATSSAFANEGDLIYLLGPAGDSLACSAYLYEVLGVKYSPAPYLNLEEERALQQLILKLIREGLVSMAKDVSDGGLAVALAEALIAGGVGAELDFDCGEASEAGFWFGEGGARAITALPPAREAAALALFAESGLPYLKLGQTRGAALRLNGAPLLDLSRAKEIYEGALPALMN